MRGTTRKAVAGIAACGLVLGATVAGIVTFAGANEAKWTICKAVSGTAKTQQSVSLTNFNTPVGVAFTLTATDCTAPNVNAVVERSKNESLRIAFTTPSQIDSR